MADRKTSKTEQTEDKPAQTIPFFAQDTAARPLPAVKSNLKAGYMERHFKLSGD